MWNQSVTSGLSELYMYMYMYIQGVSKKRYFLDFILVSVPEVGFYFFTCVLESEFRARFI